MTAEVLWMNIPLMVLAFGAWVGVPLWLVLRHPDQHPSKSRTLPAYLRETSPRRPVQVRGRAYDRQRGLAAV